ncbi:hypothetical protein SNEBB_000553 [Seison nebaliae]|nr:hypothetical protein SNEBB_000553 [Seison nebaliae]
MIRILATDSLSEKCQRLLKDGKFALKFRTDLAKDEKSLCEEVKNYDALIVRSGTEVTRAIIEAGKEGKLKVVARAGTGLDNVDVNAANENGIRVINTPSANTISAVELTCIHLLSIRRYFIPSSNELKLEGKWNRSKWMGNEVMGKKVLILGLGRIGREVSKRLSSFGMNIIGYDPLINRSMKEKCEELLKESKTEVIDKLTDEIWSDVDYITIHVPLLDTTRHLINEKNLKLFKSNITIVNCSRGGIIDDEALFKQLEKNPSQMASLDVFEDEPPKKEITKQLLKLSNVIPTPHLGASTLEAQERIGEELVELLLKYFNSCQNE